MAADQFRVLKRVTEILNLCAPGMYSADLSPRIKTRNRYAISDFVTEAGLILARALAETPNEYRAAFINIVALTHQQLLPEHQGQPAYIEIQRYSGADWKQGDRRDYRKIESYRANVNLIYDDVAHNANGSALGGYFDIWEQRFYFTGFAARGGLAQVTRSTFATKIPDVMENTWIRLGVGESAKAGDGNYSANVAGIYGRKGMDDISEFKAGRRIFAEVSDPEPTSAVHND